MKAVHFKRVIKQALSMLLSLTIILSGVAIAIPSASTIASAATVSDARLEMDFNNNWKFNLGDETSAYAKIYNDDNWDVVELPHDFSIIQQFTSNGTEAESGALPGGVGWYRKIFVLPKEYDGKQIIINFDGAYNNTEVYVNNTLVGENHYGYNSFSFDITDYVTCNGTTVNLIAVRVENKIPSSRWYSGSGLYRDVSMTVVSPVHVDLYGTQVTMPNLESSGGTDGTLDAKVTLRNDSDAQQTVTVQTRILNANGSEVGTAAETQATISSMSTGTVTLNPAVSSPTLWNTETPYLYTLRTTVLQDGAEIDVYDTQIGYRWINWAVSTGFSLNGTNTKLKGVCMHHDQGALGAVQAGDALYRQLSILKDMGCNSIRTSHNTASREFIDLCNQMGILVMEEFFDGWDSPKNGNTYDFSEYFDTEIESSNLLLGKENGQMWYEFVLTQSVKRDRNDPCVVIWDVANELNHGSDTSNYTTIVANMVNNVLKPLDDTRPVTQGNNQRIVTGSSWIVTVDSYMDVIGGNYYPASWDALESSVASLNKPFVLTETASALGTRGHYSTPYYNSVHNETAGADSNKYISAYDTTTVGWGTVATEAWYYTIINDWFAGEYVWTGFDYIGEPTPYNNTNSMTSGNPVSSYFGIVDTAGFGKDSYYLYRSMWNDKSTTLHLVPGTWDSSELYVDSNGYVDVVVYSNAKRIELLRNGDVIATAESTTNTTGANYSYKTWSETVVNSTYCTADQFYSGAGSNLYPQFHVKQSDSDVISVKAYDDNGNEITDTAGTKSVSAVTATKIAASLWSDTNAATYTADGDSYAYIELEAQDADGNFDSTYNGTVNVTVNDTAFTIAGVDNGDPTDTAKFQQPSALLSDSTAQIKLLNGRALVILRTNETVDEAVAVTFTSNDGTPVDGITLAAVAETGDELTDEFEEIVPQEDISYDPTISDRYEFLKSNIDAIESTGNTATIYDYALYTPVTHGTTTTIVNIPDGDYALYGEATNHATDGVLTHTESGIGLATDGTTGTPGVSSDVWTFKKVSDGIYQIYFVDDNGTKQYMRIYYNTPDDYGLEITTTPCTAQVSLNSAGKIVIGNNGQYLNWRGDTNDVVGLWETGTGITLYSIVTSDYEFTYDDYYYSVGSQATSLSALEDGLYIITSNSTFTSYTRGVLTHTLLTNGSYHGLQTTNDTSHPPVAGSEEHAWYFERQSNGTFYIYYVDDNGTKQYMNFVHTSGVTQGGITITTTPQQLDVDESTVATGAFTIGLNSTGGYINWIATNEKKATLYNSKTGDRSQAFLFKVNSTLKEGNLVGLTELSVTSALEDGWYVLTYNTGSSSQNSKGQVTHSNHANGYGIASSGSNATPTTDDAYLWYFEKQSDGTYYIYYPDESGTKHYINIGTSAHSGQEGNVYISTTAQALNVTVNSGKIGIGNGYYYLNWSGNTNNPNQVVGWSTATPITVFQAEILPFDNSSVTEVNPSATVPAKPVEDGEYLIYNTGDMASGSGVTTSSGNLTSVAATPVDNVITTDKAHAWTFTFVETDSNGFHRYYVQNSEGLYMNIGSSDGTLTFTESPATIGVYARSDGTVLIHSTSITSTSVNGQLLDHYTNDSVYDTWSSTLASPSDNRLMSLYRNTAGYSGDMTEEQAALYEALAEGILYEPGIYSTITYQVLLEALEDGYSTFYSETATAADHLAAAQAIHDAIAGLAVEFRYFNSTIYKYGYDPDSSTPYSAGGSVYNTQTMASMKSLIENDENLVSQIKTIIDYDGSSGTAWGSGYADIALDAAITQYAKLYTISFAGKPVANGTTDIASSSYGKTAWNLWTKTDTQGANDQADEGASVMGIFSSNLVDGRPADHAGYASGLNYYNLADGVSDYNITSDVQISVSVDGSSSKTIALSQLSDISVHTNDIFKKELVYVNDSDASQGYSKFYWDLAFPFITSTNDHGVNTYTYSSSSDNFLFQAEYDDSTNSATAELISIDEWNIERSSKGTGSGFFPFNYKKGVTSYTGENAIYHFGMTFSTDFYIPTGGTYTDGNDVIFSFSGDDDVLVYIDNVLVLDNGGLHGARGVEINFTDASVNYQFAMNLGEEPATVLNTTEYGTTFRYGETTVDTEGATADVLAALEKLNEVRTTGSSHTLSFFFLERGSTDSNCEISFNLQPTSEDVKLNNQTLVLDYGHPVSYNIQDNNYVSEAAVNNGADVVYEGITASNTDLDTILLFDPPENLTGLFTDTSTQLDVEGLNYGECTINGAGDLTYTLGTTNFTGRDYFYSCAKVTDDPTYTSDTVYYQYEKTEFIPATTIYYEDNFTNGFSFTDGRAADNFDNTTYQYGVWKNVGTQTAMSQAADLAGSSDANPYGYDPAYDNCTEYSGYSAQMVSVSNRNNPNSRFSGGSNASWPTAEFEFTGTGFDIISLTDNKSGIFYLDVYDENNTRVGMRKIVDNYYGYSYGKLYADARGNAVLDVTDTPLYDSVLGAVTKTPTYYDTDGTLTLEKRYLDITGEDYVTTETYYDADGNITETPHYYDADGNITENQTDSPAYAYAYAYAYGWVEGEEDAALYQIPVMKINDLDYGSYRVVVTCAFSNMYGHYETDADGNQFYNLYIDAIRIYNPAGANDDIADEIIKQSYKNDSEAYVSRLELKDMLIGANSLSDDAATQGVIFIDGIAASDNDLEMYKTAGPNNELYLAQNQAVAFEIWASAVPDEIQVGAKSAQGTPQLTVSYGSATGSRDITSSTEMNYSFNSVLPTSSMLTWSSVETADGIFYTTGTVVIQNTSAEDSVLSITDIKWTFLTSGAYGHYEQDTGVSQIALFSLRSTPSAAYSAMTMRYADLSISEDDVTAAEDTVTEGSPITLTVTTSEDVANLVIRDENGKLISPDSITSVIENTDNGNVKQWTVVLTQNEAGTYTYSILGEYENGYTGDEAPVEITVTVTAQESQEDDDFSGLEKLFGIFEKIAEFFRRLLAFFGIVI